jgi:hypothetical protein
VGLRELVVDEAFMKRFFLSGDGSDWEDMTTRTQEGFIRYRSREGGRERMREEAR